MAHIAAGGPFNIASGSKTTSDTAKYIHYVPLDKTQMLAIHDYYTRGDALIARANAIRSDQAFGQGFYLEWAENDRIMPDDTYDYTAGIQNILDAARKWRDMFGFVAFVKPNDAAREEIERQLENRNLTPEEIAERHIQRCTEAILEQLGGPARREQRGGGGDPARREARMREHKRINLAFPQKRDKQSARRERSRTSTDPTQASSATNTRAERIMMRPRLLAKETSMLNGNALTAADSRIDFVQKEFSAQREREKAQVEKQMALMDMLITLENVQVIDIDAGEFFLQIDDLRHTKRVVWVPRHRATNNVVSAGGPGTHLRFVDYDPNVVVYVWPGRMPTRDGIFQTDFIELLRLQQMLREAEDNAMDADFLSSHPTPFVQQSRAPTKVDAAELQEEDMYGMDIIGQDMDSLFSKKNMTPSELVTYKRDVRDAVLLEATVAAAQDEQMRRRAQTIASGMARATRATRGGLSVPDARALMFEKSGIFHLPNGLQLGGTVAPKPVVDLPFFQNAYYTQLSIALGVPLSYLRGEQAGRNSQSQKGSGKGTTSHSATTTESMMRTTIMRDRDESSLFFDSMYDAIFRSADTEALRSKLQRTNSAKNSAETARNALIAAMRESYDVIGDVAELDDNLSSLLSESARLCQLAQETRRVISLKHRLRLKFVKAPFAEHDEVQMLYEMGAISHTEMVNVLRSSIGLEKMDEDEVARVFDENMEFVAARAAALAPPPETGSVTTVETTKEGQTKSVGQGESMGDEKAKTAGGGGGGASKSSGGGGAGKPAAQSKQTAATEKKKEEENTQEKERTETRVEYGERQSFSVSDRRKQQKDGEKEKEKEKEEEEEEKKSQPKKKK